MLIKELRIPKTTQSYADTLVAVGVAKILSWWPHNCQPTLYDEGHHYRIILKNPLDTEFAVDEPLTPGYPYIRFKAKDEAHPLIGKVIDYEAAKLTDEVYHKFRDASRGRARKAARDLEEQPPEPRSDIQLLKDFNSLRMSSPAYNNLCIALAKEENLAAIFLNRLGRYLPDSPQMPFPNIAEPTLPASNLQLFSPISGKGVHRPKPDGTGLGGLSDAMVDWFEEWMKYVSMHSIMTSHRAGDDTKVLVLAPQEIGIYFLEEVREDLLRKQLWGNIRLEIMATIIAARTLIDRSEFIRDEGIPVKGRKPRDLISGIYSAHFKSLGTGKAIMNLSFLGLPGWFPINSKEDAVSWLEILHEHSECLKTLDEDPKRQSGYGEDIPLLMAYRDFIAGGGLWDFLRFSVGYGVHCMGRLVRKEWVRELTTVNLGRLFMSYDGIKDIIENRGFRNIAAAIRKATVSAQYRKAITGKQVFEIHYGLAQEWKRQMKFKQQFVTALMDFVQQYNMENARHAEQDKETRARISTEDLDQVIHLIETKGSELVGMLLLAYGYAKDTSEKEEVKE